MIYVININTLHLSTNSPIPWYAVFLKESTVTQSPPFYGTWWSITMV